MIKNTEYRKTGYYGPLTFWTAKNNSTITLVSNLVCTMYLNRTRKLTIYRESCNDSLMLVNWMFLFLYVGWIAFGLILLTPRSTSRRCATRYISCVRYVRTVNTGRSRTPLRIFIKNIWIMTLRQCIRMLPPLSRNYARNITAYPII